MSAVDRLRAHAAAAKSLSEAQAYADALSYGEHPDVLEDAEATLQAASAAERKARLAYVDPFGLRGN